MRNLKQKLQNSIKELDYENVSWINKHYVIDLYDKATVLLISLDTANKREQEALKDTVVEFIETVQPIIRQIKNKEI